MDRRLVYIGEIPQDIDVLESNLNPYEAIAKLADAILGKTQILNNFACVPTAPATLTVNVGYGEIYSLQEIDTTAYGSITTNSNEIVKQGIKFGTTNLSCPAPVTLGYSVNYLVQIAFSEVDTESVVLPYYNSADINNPLSGPGNSGVAQNTIRQDGVTVSVKTGIAAPTGTQVTPSPDTGYTGAYVVTVAYGQTTITSGSISVYSADSFINETLTQKVSIPTGDLRWAQITRVQSSYYNFGTDTGTANAYITALTPAIATYSTGISFSVLIANTNTTTSTINVNGLGAKTIKLVNGDNLSAGDLLAGMIAYFEYDGTNVQLINPPRLITAAQIQNGSLIYSADTGTANSYVAALTPAPIAYTAGMGFFVKIANTNTAASTLNLNGLGIKNIKLINGAAINEGDLVNGQIAQFEYDGTNIQLLNPGTTIKKINVQTFTTSGTYTASSGLVYADVQIVAGGGGGGGGAGGSGQVSAGSGGGGGGYSKKTIKASTIGSSQTVTIGSGGTGGAAGNNNGTSGGSTSFGALFSASGGAFGVGGFSTPAYHGVAPGGGGTGSSGDINLKGGSGGGGYAIAGELVITGRGGSSFFAQETWQDAGTVSAVTGNLYGGGGPGGANELSASGYPGGNGASGIIVVTEYLSS